MMGVTVEVSCKWCECTFTARTADRKRGWAKCCSKACAASLKTFGKNKAFWERANPSNSTSNIKRYAGRLFEASEHEWGHPMASGYEGHGQS